MKNQLKGAGLIAQCTRCFSLRDQQDVDCPTCRHFFDAAVKQIRWLVLNDISNDVIDSDTYDCRLQ
jgi:hypothetical protein